MIQFVQVEGTHLVAGVFNYGLGVYYIFQH